MSTERQSSSPTKLSPSHCVHPGFTRAVASTTVSAGCTFDFGGYFKKVNYLKKSKIK